MYGDVARLLPGLFLTDMGQSNVPRIRRELFGSNLNVNNTRAGIGIGELMHWGWGVSEVALYDSTSPASYSIPWIFSHWSVPCVHTQHVRTAITSRCMLTFSYFLHRA